MKYGKLKIFSATVLFSLNPALAANLSAADTLILDLDKSIGIALEKNHRVKTAREKVSMAFARIEENRASAWPELSAKADYTRIGNVDKYNFGGQALSLVPENNYKLDLNLKQKVYAPEVFEAIRASRTFASSVEMEFDVIKEDVATEVKKAYYRYLFSREMIAVSEESVRQLRRHVDNVRIRLEVGLATDFDLLRAEVRLANSVPALTRAKNDLAIAGASLRIAIGLDPAAKVEVTGELDYSPFDMPLDEALEAAMRERPELSYIDYYIRTLNSNVEVAKKEFRPKLSLHGNLSYANDDLSAGGKSEWDYSWNIGLTLDYKIFDGWKRSSKVRQNLIDVSTARIEKEQLIRAINLDVKTASGRLNEARELIRSQEKNIENAVRAYEIAAAGNREGVVTELELLDAQLALTEARSNYKRAVYDWLIAKTEMERAIGRALRGYSEEKSVSSNVKER